MFEIYCRRLSNSHERFVISKSTREEAEAYKEYLEEMLDPYEVLSIRIVRSDNLNYPE